MQAINESEGSAVLCERLIQTYGPLNPTEASQVQAQLRNERLEFDQIGGQIMELEGKLKDLKQAQKILERRIFVYQASLCLIRQIPVEIWREIFIYATSKPMGILPSSIDPRLTITHTCSFWRKMALDIPELWTNYEIVPIMSIYEGHSRPKCISFMEVVFARAKDLLLSLSTPTRISAGSVFPLYLSSDLLTPYQSRFGQLDLALPLVLLEMAVREWLDNISFPSVRQFSLRVAMISEHPEIDLSATDTSVLFHEFLPEVEHLTLVLPWMVESMAMPWSQLKSLHIHVEWLDVAASELALDQITHARNLEKLVFYVSGPIRTEPSIEVRLPALRSLEIISYGQTYTFSFLQLLSFPSNFTALQSVAISLPSFNLSEDEEQLVGLGLQPYLQKLVITDPYEGSEQDILGFAQFPKLSELHINLHPPSSESDDPPFQERLTDFLQTLEEMQAGDGVADAKLSGAKFPFSYIKVVFPPYHLTLAHFDAIRRLRSKGLVVEIAEKLSLDELALQ